MFGYISPPDFYLISIARRFWSTFHNENCLMLVFLPLCLVSGAAGSLVWFICAEHNVLSFQINHKFQRIAVQYTIVLDVAPAPDFATPTNNFCPTNGFSRFLTVSVFKLGWPMVALRQQLSYPKRLSKQRGRCICVQIFHIIFIVFLWHLGIWPKSPSVLFVLVKNVKRISTLARPQGELWAKRDTHFRWRGWCQSGWLWCFQLKNWPSRVGNTWFVAVLLSQPASQVRFSRNCFGL